MRGSKILQFPMGGAGGGSLKLFTIIFYLFVVFMLTFITGVSEGSIGFLLMLGLLYHFFVRNRLRLKSYIKRNGILLAIILGLLLWAYPLVTAMVLLIAGLYWLLIARSGKDSPYFLRFHILTALILNFMLLMAFLLFDATMTLLELVFKVAQLSAVTAPVFGVYHAWIPYLMLGILWGTALWLSFSAMMGRTPYIGVVTSNVRHLA
jgi:hypothetical protein